MTQFPKITLACIGKFHHFDLARQLYRRSMLEYIFTGYPRWKLYGEKIPQEKIKTFPWLETLYLGINRIDIFNHKMRRELAWWSHRSFDGYVRNAMPNGDILFALSSSVLEAAKKMQSLGGKFVCDRGSSHIQYQNKILQEEYRRWKVDFSGVDPRFIATDEECYDVADFITVPSLFVYRTFLEHGVEESKLRRIPYGVDLDLYKKVADPAPEWFDVLFVGQVSFRKGIPYLLEAYKRFRHPKKRLTIVGAIQPEIKTYLGRQEIGDDIRFLGIVPQTELKNIMSSSHVMILPSIEEGLALVQAQAMACACPVIGTENSGAEDLFEDDIEGFITPIRDTDTIVDRLGEMADNPLKRQKMSEAALTRVKNLGGWDTYGDQMVNMFTQLHLFEDNEL